VSVDFQVVFPSEVVELTSVRLVPGANPPQLDISGKDFRSVDEVVINDIASSDVIVVSKNRLIATIPEGARGGFPMRVLITSRKLTITPKSLIRFKIGRTPSKVRGILKLIQLFLKLLFTTPGTDIFSPKLGSAGLKDIGRTFGKDQTGTIVTDFVIAVDTTARQIINLQGRDPSLPLDERLLRAKVQSSGFDPVQSALIVTVEITSQAGSTATTNVVV
jgi:hypothetical protein